MPQTLHVERHFTGKEIVKDIVIGMSDGLTVPFALAAGLSGAVLTSNLIVTGGLAEVAAGSIAMGLGGYMAAKSDRDHYLAEQKREAQEVIERPEQERAEVIEVFRTYGLKEEQIEPILKAFQDSPRQWVNFMMRFELGMEEPNPQRALNSALTIALSYIVGGLIPLVPYMLITQARNALFISILVTSIALLVFGYIKGYFTGNKPLRSAIQTLLVGSLAAAVAFIIAKLIAA